MSANPISVATTPATGTVVFPAMYYDSPESQLALGFDVSRNDSLTAAVTAGAPYFKVSKIDVCDWITVPVEPLPRPPVSEGGPLPAVAIDRTLGPPVATSDGTTPLSVAAGQYARLWVTAEVPQGSALAVGEFTGTVVLKGQGGVVWTGTLQCTYLGTLIGKVSVQPATVVPSQPVLVQVLNASGNPLSDPSVTVTIQGVPASARWYQFPEVGDYNLVVRAVRGSLSETAQVTVPVAGTPWQFRTSLTAPVVTEMPVLQAASVLGQPYTATFTLGNTASIRRVLAGKVSMTAPAGQAPAPAAPVAPPPSGPAPVDALGAEMTKAFAALPAAEVIRVAPVSTTTATGVATSSAVLAPVGGWQAAPTTTSYQWDFGDGQTLTTQVPAASHDYLPAIRAGQVAHSFDVTCTVVHDDVTVKRTLVLHSAYGLCRQLGVVVPPVIGDTYATFQHVAFSASLIVQNLEASPITLHSMACVPLTDAAAVALPAPAFTTMSVPLVIAAGSASALGVYVPLSQLTLPGAVVNGFAVHYSGEMPAGDGTSTPVRFSRAFRIPLSDSGLFSVTLPTGLLPISWDHGAALQSAAGLVTQAGGVSKAGGQAIDPATNTIAIALSADAGSPATLAQVQASVQAGLTSIALKTGALTLDPQPAAPVTPVVPVTLAPRDNTVNPLNPPPVAAGNECYPDDISDADAATAAAQQLVCQLTGETSTETIPSSFQNAQAGDVILSPAPVGTGDLIAALFRALDPPQHHGHSGIMTANFFEITHCTASTDRVQADMNMLGPIPTSLNADRLQYAWPGSLTQSIDDATSTVNLTDPGGASYPLNSFNTDTEGDGFEIIPPLVIKPLPENEAAVRPRLRQAADTARSKGAQYDSSGHLVSPGGCYYSFYAYTDPQLSAGFTHTAGPEAGWAQGLSPAVCSSFVWLSLKENGIPLVTSNQTEQLSDFSAAAVAGGAEVGSATLDGLIFYPEAERVQGANALYQMLMNQALSKEGGFGTIPGVNQEIAGPIADQLLNDFAFGDPTMVGSTAWQEPGDGNAVSPDNIIWWNPPYYGYAEPLQYLPQHLEQYTVSRWTKVTTWGSISGTVQFNGAPVPNAHVWVYLPGGDAYTAANGGYTLNHIPVGPYELKAQAVITTNGISAEYTNGLGGQQVALTAADPNITENIDLQGLPANYRRMDFTYSISCDHGDGNPFNTHGVQTAGPYTRSLDVNPGQVTNSLTYSYDYNGGGYFHIDYAFTIALLQDLSIEVTLIGTMYDDGSGDVQDQYTLAPFNVPVGRTVSGYTSMEHSNGYHNGPAVFNFSVTNNQQTG